MAHKKHRWLFEVAYLTPGANRIKAAVAIWMCRCGATTNREYLFRKPPPTAETAGVRARTLLDSERSQWPEKEGKDNL